MCGISIDCDGGAGMVVGVGIGAGEIGFGLYASLSVFQYVAVSGWYYT